MRLFFFLVHDMKVFYYVMYGITARWPFGNFYLRNGMYIVLMFISSIIDIIKQ